MEHGRAQDPNRLINVLNQAKELARQLESHLGLPDSTQLCRSLARNLLSTWDRAISFAKQPPGEPVDGEGQPGAGSPRSGSGSPGSDGSDRGPKEQELMEVCKKRKTAAGWRWRLLVGAGARLEAPADDGFSWRKYGQKDILGAKYPRGYYRCTHRYNRGCLATKQVQRCDDNPFVFDVTYLGAHTCSNRSAAAAAGPSMAGAPPPFPEQEVQRRQQQVPLPSTPAHGDDDVESLLLSFGTGLTVRTDDPDRGDPFGSSSSSFTPTPTPTPMPVSSCRRAGNHVLPPPPTLLSPAPGQSPGSFSPAFASPPPAAAASETVHSPAPPCRGQESDLAGEFYAGAPAVDPGFMLDFLESEPDFPELDARFLSEKRV